MSAGNIPTYMYGMCDMKEKWNIQNLSVPQHKAEHANGNLGMKYHM